MTITFNKPPYIGKENEYVLDAVKKRTLLTTSCTHATEMAAFLSDIKLGDEVIMPSYTFVSTADAFLLRGATLVSVDIRPDTMNIDETLIEDAITPRTKAIVLVHYVGVGCEMDTQFRIDVLTYGTDTEKVLLNWQIRNILSLEQYLRNA